MSHRSNEYEYFNTLRKDVTIHKTVYFVTHYWEGVAQCSFKNSLPLLSSPPTTHPQIQEGPGPASRKCRAQLEYQGLTDSNGNAHSWQQLPHRQRISNQN